MKFAWLIVFVSIILIVAFCAKYVSKLRENFYEDDVDKLKNIHTKLNISHGSLDDEYPEQLMAVKYIQPYDVVLEIGGNIGRNSCVISSLLKDSRNLLVIESDPNSIDKLTMNRDQNHFRFKIENNAISNVDLFQNHWNTSTTKESDEWKQVPTKPWSDIKAKYKMPFTTLVADCEGALYNILKENPTFLEGFKTIIIENDFRDITHKQFVDKEFTRFGFQRVYHEAGGFQPCYDFFYEVWKKNT